METKSTTRVLTLMESVGLSQVKFAERCGIRPSNFNRALKSEKGLSPQYLLRIAHAFNVNFEWLRNGIGEMFAEEKAIGKAQFAAFNQMLDANTRPVSQNIISGDNYQGVQTINATEDKIPALEQKIETLTQLLAEKDKLIASQQAWLADKDNYCPLPRALLGGRDRPLHRLRNETN